MAMSTVTSHGVQVEVRLDIYMKDAEEYERRGWKLPFSIGDVIMHFIAWDPPTRSFH